MNHVLIGSLLLNFKNIRDSKILDPIAENLRLNGWTLILKFNQPLPANSKFHLSKALNLNSIENGQAISFTAHQNNFHIFQPKRKRNYKNFGKFEISFVGDFSQINFQVSKVYLLEGIYTDVRCFFEDLSPNSSSPKRYGTPEQPVLEPFSSPNLQKCENLDFP